MSETATGRGGRAAFVLLMLALTVAFIALGSWQMARLGEKEALIAAVDERLDDPPRPFPPRGDWTTLDVADFDYLPLTVSGRFVPSSTVPVFTSLAADGGGQGGPGYWLMTGFALDGGGTVFVNRGYIPQDRLADLDGFEPMNPAAGSLSLSGIGRRAEKPNMFTPAPDPEQRIEWVRDPERLAAMAGVGEPVAPLYVDLPAGPAGTLPRGGETVVEFPNNHLGYAMTWFGFAILTPILLGFWLRRPRARRQTGPGA